MHVAIIINESRKDNPQLTPELIETLAKKYQLSYQIFFVKPDEIESITTKLIQESYDAILVGGGDGTVRSVAQLTVDTDIPLAIFPLGTFNYFAKELNFPADLEQLFKIIKTNKLKQVDVGEVNNYIFLNHSSIGFYSHILKMREKHTQTLKNYKLLKIIYTAFNFFHALPIYQLKMQIDDKTITVNTCLLFVGNNYHFTDLFNFGERASLTSGQLAIYILKCQSRWSVLKCVLSILFNKFNQANYLLQYSSTNLSIDAKSKLIYVVIDGDLFKLETPLNYLIHNKKLTVFSADD